MCLLIGAVSQVSDMGYGAIFLEGRGLHCIFCYWKDKNYYHDRPDIVRHLCMLFQPEIEEFLELLALCHTVRVDHHEANQTGASALYSHSGMEYEYQSSSPDEKAFVEACRR